MHLLGLLNPTNLVATAGYGAVFVLCLLQSCCVPTSSELTMGFAGVLAAQGKLSLAGVIAVGVAGEVVGAYVAWAVGRYAGRAAVDRFGRYVLLTHRDLDRAEAWYGRHERFGVFGSRLLPVIRNFVAVPAGIAEVPLGRFGLLTAAGSLLWDGAWAGIGYGVGSHWHAIASGIGGLGYVLAVAAVGLVVFAAYHRYRSYKHAASAGETAQAAMTSPRPDVPRRAEFPGSPIAAWEAAVRRGRTQAPAPSEPPRGAAAPAPEPDPQVRPRRHPSSPASAGAREGSGHGQLPLVGRFFPAPAAAKVPEVLLVFWVVKILTTAGGEAMSDYLKHFGNLEGGGVEVGLFAIGLLLQFGTRRYQAFGYWFLAFAIATFGTGVADFLHLDVHIPYAGTTLMWAIILAAVFWLWQRSEGTLSIHSITTQRREAFYWATVFATFALGTALGDFTATSLHLGYLTSGILFGVVILIPALLRWQLGLNAIAAFWMSYVVTRPLGASFADYIGRPHSLSGIDYGAGPTAAIFALAVLALVGFLAIARPDIQGPVGELGQPVRSRPSVTLLNRPEPELDPE